jgi:threonine dehydrogenase-like Zn-dependent dehydrogenase
LFGLATTVGQPDTTSFGELSEPRACAGDVLLRPVRVGLCGTDREIADGLFGVAPEGEARLILGHEMLARVDADGGGFTRGDLVCATVRRSCRHCPACAGGSPDACLSGDYLERGITRLHGFAAELVVESPEHLINVPDGLGALAVLAEPASVCARGIRHAELVAGRQVWNGRRAFVLGTGAIGLLATYLLRMRGYDVWVTSQAPAGAQSAQLAMMSGATYFSTADVTPAEAALDVNGFDVVLEATGDSQVMLDTLSLLARNGVACLLGIDGRPRNVTVDGRVLGMNTVLQNRALIGSVNAHREDWVTAIHALTEARHRWPDALESFVGLTVAPDAFAEAFAFRGVKATLEFGAL